MFSLTKFCKTFDNAAFLVYFSNFVNSPFESSLRIKKTSLKKLIFLEKKYHRENSENFKDFTTLQLEGKEKIKNVGQPRPSGVRVRTGEPVI